MVIRFLLAFLAILADLGACTGLLLKAKDKAIVTGRTVEFGSNLDMSVAVIPRDLQFVGETPKGKGKTYKSKYAAVGVFCFEDKKLMDGMNEKGLVAAAFYFPGYADYGKITDENQTNALSPAEFPNWILTQFATVDEVKAAIPTVVIAPTVLKGWGSTPPPFHYIVYDNEGKSIVIEPVNGSLVVHENKIGVITNSPTFDWHLTNLDNYINLSPYNVNALDLRGVELSGLGQGSGMLGLPGDFTSPSRFVRAVFFSTFAPPPENAAAGVDQVFHLLNQFDLPYGTIRGKEGGKTSYDITWLTSVKDSRNGKYFYRSFGDQAIRYVDLNQFNMKAKEIKSMKVKGSQKAIDVSSLLRT